MRPNFDDEAVAKLTPPKAGRDSAEREMGDRVRRWRAISMNYARRRPRTFSLHTRQTGNEFERNSGGSPKSGVLSPEQAGVVAQDRGSAATGDTMSGKGVSSFRVSTGQVRSRFHSSHAWLSSLKFSRQRN